MKVIQVTPKYYPVLGGVEEVVKQYSERLASRGHQVEVFTGNSASPSLCELSADEQVNGVRVIRSRTFHTPIDALSPVPAIVPKLWRSVADIYHLHANKYFTTDAAALICRLKGRPFVFSPHAGTFGNTLLGVLHNNTIGRWALSARVVICVSEYERSLIANSGIPVRRLEVIPNGVDTSAFAQPTSFNFFGSLGLAGRPAVFYLGRLSAHKGLDTLFEAARKIIDRDNDPVFVLAGPDGGVRKQLQRRMEKYGLQGRIVLAGKITEEEKISALQNAAVFCLPSFSEAFGIVVVEAMAAGCPVVVSDVMALPEIVTHKQTGLLFRAGDVNLLFEQIQYLLDNKEERLRLSGNARKMVKSKYDWEGILDRLEEVYKAEMLIS